MKGMVFAGCSFTWGQGLYFYHDMNKSNIPLTPHYYDESKLKSTDFLYKNTLRFPRLVANHFKTFEIVKRYNGGSDQDSICFLRQLFKNDGHYDLCDYKFSFNDIEYVIFQTTQPIRSPFKFKYKDKNILVDLLSIFDNQGEGYVHDVDPVTFQIERKKVPVSNEHSFLEWMKKNKFSINDIFDLHIKNIINEITLNMEFFDSHNIKSRILCWTDEYLKSISKNDYLSERFISLNYDNKQFDCIDDMFEYDKTLEITHDPEKKIEVEDGHPSKKCHQVIANSIISHIEEYEKNISNR
jgi:hypothetical protein